RRRSRRTECLRAARRVSLPPENRGDPDELPQPKRKTLVLRGAVPVPPPAARDGVQRDQQLCRSLLLQESHRRVDETGAGDQLGEIRRERLLEAQQRDVEPPPASCQDVPSDTSLRELRESPRSVAEREAPVFCHIRSSEPPPVAAHQSFVGP